MHRSRDDFTKGGVQKTMHMEELPDRQAKFHHCQYTVYSALTHSIV
ncbi:hypothetical protein GBAR_LOCUS6839 [Geodia barretti]|uniref:Uncharacterized protein n=1 Tax=Geodia barretti TaxID=519541 RepID=A0AA35WAS2_GEOBA|nr:hypothetical protein GBAR_LOCUS6839 [Geodia barretti]